MTKEKKMLKKFIIIHSLLMLCLLLFTTQGAIAGPDWKEKQKEMFAQVQVKVGNIIDKTNWEKVEGLVPDQFLNTIKKGEWILEIGEFEYDHDYTDAYYKLSAQNKGKYILGPRKEILDVSTGKFPIYINGMPFPDIDIKNDPDGPAKFMHNQNLNIFIQGQYEGLAYPKKGNLQWVGRKSGYERGVGFLAERVYYWNRPRGEISNPRKYKGTVINLVTFPYDMYGTATLYVRHLDGRPDSVFAYVPAIRRVKRLSGANRSDPQMGSDMTMDDSKGFDGHIESMKWTYMDEKIMLKPVWKPEAKAPRKLNKTQTGSWEYPSNDSSCDMGYHTPGWTAAMWAYTKLVWIPREMYVLKMDPLDPFYNYGVHYIYVDKLTTMIHFSLKHTRSGEFWKSVISVPGTFVWRDGEKAFSMDGPMTVIDHKSDHASCLGLGENRMDFDTRRVNPKNHNPTNLRTMTK